MYVYIYIYIYIYTYTSIHTHTHTAPLGLSSTEACSNDAIWAGAYPSGGSLVPKRKKISQNA